MSASRANAVWVTCGDHIVPTQAGCDLRPNVGGIEFLRSTSATSCASDYSESTNDPILITPEKGSYEPLFERNPAPAPLVVTVSEAGVSPEEKSSCPTGTVVPKSAGRST